MLEILREAPTPQQTGAPASPASIARRLKVAQAMQAAGLDYSPVQSWTQGAARVAQALVGAWKERQADTEEKAGEKSAADAFAGLFGGGGAAGPQASAVPSAPAAPASSGTANTKLDFSSPTMSEIKRGAIDVGKQLGVDPKDILSAVSYETGGTFDPWKAGPTTQWGQHRGLIQWGEPQRQQYGVTEQTSPYDQMLAAGKYLQAAGVRPGMGLMDIYSAINAGKVGRYGASDANNGGAPGTVADKVNNQMGGHIANAMALLNAGGSSTLAPPGINAMQDLVQRGPVTAQVGDLVQRGQAQGEMMPAVQVASANPGFAPQMPVAAPQQSPASPPAGPAVVAQAMQNAPQQVAQAAPSPSPVQAVAGAARGVPSVQQLIAASQNPWLSEGQRGVVNALLSQALKPQEFGFQSLPDGTIVRTDPRTGTVQPIYQGQVKPVEVNGRLVNPNTGQVIADYSNPQTVTVGNSVIDPRTGKVIFQNPPNQEFKELNGRLIAVDPRSGGARDVTPNGVPSGYRPATDQERAQFGVAPGVPLYFGPDGKPASLGPQTSVSIQGGESQFDKTVGEGQGKMFLGLAEDGPQAKADLGNIQQLRGAIATLPGGFLGGAQAIANQYGIKLGENAGNLEYANAILSKLTPAQRQGMPGAASDRDVQMFRDALPKLSNTPEGNKLILDTMEALANQRLEQARIATMVTTNQMNRQDGMKALQDLPDPFAGLKAAIGPREAPKQGAVVPAAPQAAQPAPGAPQPGTVDGGYRFRGGDPSKPENWEKVQ